MIVSRVFVLNVIPRFEKQLFVECVFSSDDLSVLKIHNVIMSVSMFVRFYYFINVFKEFQLL